MKVRRITVIAVLAAVLLVGYVFRGQIAMAVAMKVAASKLAADGITSLPDGLHVGLCGAGSPFPDDKRGGPCTLVIAGKRQFVFDAGSGASRTIGKMGFNQGDIAAVFLSHFHSDHIDGLGELMLQRWVSNSNTEPVPVYGPKGVEMVLMGLRMAYVQDQHYRVAHHGDATVPASGFGARPMPFALDPAQHTVVFKDDVLEIIAFEVAHAPIHPAVGYRISYKGRTVVLSGDTVKSAAVQREAQGVDLLVHEALSVPLVEGLKKVAGEVGRTNLRTIFNDIMNYHATPEQAAETARDAKVGYLLLNHIVPTLPALPGLEKAFLGDAPSIFSGPVRVGADGDFVSLPVGSKEINHTRRF